jgi:hypothetical protein
MEPEGSLPPSQKLVTRPFLYKDESIPHSDTI